MKVISFYESDRQEHWLGKIAESDWSAGRLLHRHLCKGTFRKTYGESSKVLLLTEGEELVSFCTYAERDDIQPTELSPWMGFVFTFPAYRGHRYVGLLSAEAERLAREEHKPAVYISTGHVGLYEKYGYRFLDCRRDMNGEMERVYMKEVRPESP